VVPGKSPAPFCISLQGCDDQRLDGTVCQAVKNDVDRGACRWADRATAPEVLHDGAGFDDIGLGAGDFRWTAVIGRRARGYRTRPAGDVATNVVPGGQVEGAGVEQERHDCLAGPEEYSELNAPPPTNGAVLAWKRHLTLSLGARRRHLLRRCRPAVCCRVVPDARPGPRAHRFGNPAAIGGVRIPWPPGTTGGKFGE